MKRTYAAIALAVVAVLSAIGSTAFAADTFNIDPVHSSITFAVRHMVISNVKGHFNEYEGTIHYNAGDMSKSSVTVKIAAASIDTNNKRRDGDVSGEGFFNAEKYPDITFDSERIEETDDGFVAHGNLTIHGVTQEIALPFTLSGPIQDPWGNTRIGIEATIKLNRQDYGITYSEKLDNGGLMVGDKIKIELQIEAVKAEAKAD